MITSGASTVTAVVGTMFTVSVLFGPKVYRVSSDQETPYLTSDVPRHYGSVPPKGLVAICLRSSRRQEKDTEIYPASAYSPWLAPRGHPDGP